LDEDDMKRLLTEALSELGASILSERGKWTSIDLLVGGLHPKHSFGAAVALLG
jgi:hypothetical protein